MAPSRRLNRAWTPSALERKCLAHLDHEESWRILGRERPDEGEAQPWAPFRRIFAINLVPYAIVLALVFVGLEAASGVGPADVREDLPLCLAAVAAIAGAMALYTAHLYRRSWNRRAREIRRMRGVGEDVL